MDLEMRLTICDNETFLACPENNTRLLPWVGRPWFYAYTWEECAEKCRQNEGSKGPYPYYTGQCAGWSFGGICFLFANFNGSETSDYVSGHRYCRPKKEELNCPERGVALSITSPNINEDGMESWWDCSDKCTKDSSCQVFTWYSPPAGKPKCITGGNYTGMQKMPVEDFVVSGSRQCCRNCSALTEIKIVYKENEISKDIIG